MYKTYDNSIAFDNNDFFRIIRPFEIGSHAEIYKLRIGQEIYAVKLFNGVYAEEKSNYENKLRISIPSFITPKKLLYINDKFKGYAMYFVKDKNLMDRNLNLTVGDFATKIVDLMNDTKKLTELKFCIYDGFLTNVMYEDGFKLIDTDSYTYHEKEPLSKIDEINNLRLNKMLLDVFAKNAYLISSVFAYVQDRKIAIKDKKVNELFKKCDNGDISFEEFFNAICVKAYNVADQELEKISDVGKVLRKI